ncbi:MAG: hypothetical protein IKY52_06580, partial [Clostridia bacterium]|nr:hypothetical protein [Clostridia bacterium]
MGNQSGKNTQKYRIYARQFFREDSFENDVIITVENGVITAMENGVAEDADCTYTYVTPGLIDNHIHGGDGYSVYGSTPEEI